MTDSTLPPTCKDHPCAPHGFNRSASHQLHRDVCECEFWSPDKSCASAPLLAEIDRLKAQIQEQSLKQLSDFGQWQEATEENARLKAQVAELQRLAQPLSSKPDGCTHPLCSCEAGCFYGSTPQ